MVEVNEPRSKESAGVMAGEGGKWCDLGWCSSDGKIMYSTV